MSRNDMSSLLDVLPRSDGNLVYNMSKSIYINSDTIPRELYTDYIIQVGDSWTLISYIEFGTIELWWLICKFNNIISPVDMPVVGDVIKIPISSIVEQIISGM